jgi:polyferredoxin
MEGETFACRAGRTGPCALKYLLLGFFVQVIFFRMTLADMRAFLDNSFNQTADVRLLQLFLHPSATTLMVLAILAGLSLWIRHFWCRYLCPYGALTTLVGLASPTRIRRNPLPASNAANAPGLVPPD